MIKILVYILYANFFLVVTTFAGNGIRNLFNINIYNRSINLSISFYLGLIISIVSFRILGDLFGPDYAAYITLVILFIFIFIFFDFMELIRNLKIIIPYTVIIFVLSVFLILYWHPTSNSIEDKLSVIGSLHSVKYAWISNYIATCNLIPVLGQNTGQSIYVSLLNILSSPMPFLYLSILLAWAQFFLFLLIFSVIKIYINTSRSFIYSFAIFLGTSTLSITYVLIIDSGSSLLMNGYTDTLIGIFSIFIFYNIYKTIGVWKLRDYSLYGILLIANFLSSPQNIIYIFIINLIITLFFLKNWILLKKLLLINFFTIIICIFAVFLGGMLTPSSLQTNLPDYAIQTLSSKSSNLGMGFKVIPGVPFFYGSMSGEWIFGNMDLLKASQHIMSEPDLRISNLIWLVESIFFNSIRALTIPLIGIIFIIFNIKKNYSRGKLKYDDNLKFSFLTIALFSLGFFICFFVSYNGYKWEFSRFLIPGHFLAYISFCIFLEYMMIKNHISIISLNVIILLLVLGPLCDFIITIFFNSSYIFNHIDHLNNFFGAGPVINRDLCLIK